MKIDRTNGQKPIHICECCGMSDVVERSDEFVHLGSDFAVCGACLVRPAEDKAQRARDVDQPRKSPAPGFETSRLFAIAFAQALGLDTEQLLSFNVQVGGNDDEDGAVVIVSAKYLAPRGAGEAAATVIRDFSLVAGPQTVSEGESVDRSTSLMTGRESIHRAAPEAPLHPVRTSETPAPIRSVRP
ncbi:hypothetical protein [Delftia tsuruhatensis]|uniref:hypothetical protein n=1 Tax=Delftia tsuruhatensis TaxID=180282 RepID=UPI0020913AC9|nr:hypothetical protein [Delftia tsuruhatensis]MCO5338586.1 hypothetical protein [Delftia tsuruhatensis]MCR4546630.1 hypothetical protein [Delftia tsuruhatensis]